MPDWTKIKAEYMAGKKPADICKRHKIKRNTFDARMRRGNWSPIKKQAHKKSTEKLPEKLADREAERIIAVKDKMAEKFNDALEKLKSVKVRNSLDAGNYTRALRNIQDGLFKCYGIADKSEISAKVESIEYIVKWPESKKQRS